MMAKLDGGQKRERSIPVNGVIAAAILCALVVFQGGYYAGAVCVLGMVAMLAYVAYAAISKKALALPLAAAFLFAIALVYLVSALVHGATFTMLQEAATWFALAGMSLWCVFDAERDKRRTLDAVALVGAVLAVAGIAMFSGILPMEGTVNAGRLMFTFQYANASGLLFAVMAVLCLCSADRRLRIVSVLPVAALLLTQSVGAILVFVAGAIVVGVRLVRVRELDFKLAIGFLVALVAACAAVVIALPARVLQASQTFVERLIQMADAASVLASNLGLGVGPNQWQFAYPTIQTAQYRATDVHCSFLQVALDAGVVAALLLAAALAVGAVLLFKRGDFACGLGVSMVGVHALFDFDFQFGAIVFMVALLLGGVAPSSNNASQKVMGGAVLPSKVPAAACWCAALVALACSCGGVFLDVRAGAAQSAAGRADVAAVSEVVGSSPVFADDPRMQELLVSTLFEAGDYRGAVEAADEMAKPTAAVEFQRVIAHIQLGETEGARTAMQAMLHARPYDPELYEAARDLVTEASPSDGFAETYDAEARRANELAQSGHAAWLDNQELAALIGGGEAA